MNAFEITKQKWLEILSLVQEWKYKDAFKKITNTDTCGYCVEAEYNCFDCVVALYTNRIVCKGTPYHFLYKCLKRGDTSQHVLIVSKIQELLNLIRDIEEFREEHGKTFGIKELQDLPVNKEVKNG